MSDTPPTLYCANHPTIETSLRCNNCEKPICPKCAILTPTGYRCRDCVRNQQKVFNTSTWYDSPLAFLIAAALSFAGSFVVSFAGFFTLFLAPIAGMIAAEAVRMATQKRRSKTLYLSAAAGALLGSLPQLAAPLLSLFLGGGSNLFGLLWRGFYAFTITTSVYYRLRGINIR